MRWRIWIAVGATSLAASLGPMLASARVEARTGHSKARTYNAALRYLRVDLGYDVTEKDEEAAYLLFQFTPTGRKEVARGSIEIVEGQENVRIFVQIPQMPRYREQVLSDGLIRKLKEEFGDPPPKAPKNEPKEPAADGGT